MLRGKHKLKALTDSIQPAEQTLLFPAEETTLYDEKVKLLIARYCFYLGNTPNYQDILTKLSKEFFISTGRIADILVSKSDEIKALKNNAPKQSWYKVQWAHLVW